MKLQEGFESASDEEKRRKLFNSNFSTLLDSNSRLSEIYEGMCSDLPNGLSEDVMILVKLESFGKYMNEDGIDFEIGESFGIDGVYDNVEQCIKFNDGTYLDSKLIPTPAFEEEPNVLIGDSVNLDMLAYNTNANIEREPFDNTKRVPQNYEVESTRMASPGKFDVIKKRELPHIEDKNDNMTALHSIGCEL